MANQELQNLIEKNLLLSMETRTLILSELESLDEEKKEKLTSLLNSAQEKQDEWFKTAFQENPELLKQIQKHLRDTTFDSIREKEDDSRTKEIQTLSCLENELNTLFK